MGNLTPTTKDVPTEDELALSRRKFLGGTAAAFSIVPRHVLGGEPRRVGQTSYRIAVCRARHSARDNTPRAESTSAGPPSRLVDLWSASSESVASSKLVLQPQMPLQTLHQK